MSDHAAMGLEAAFLDHLRARAGSESVVAQTVQAFGHLRRFLGARRGEDATPLVLAVATADLERFATYLAEYRRTNGAALAEGTQAVYFARVVRFFRFLARSGRMLLDVTASLPRRRTPLRLPRAVPTQDEMRAILETPDVTRRTGIRDRAMLELMYSTGLRRAEVMRLAVQDVDLVGRLVRVRMGKGKKDRIVPLGRVAEQWVSEYVYRVRREIVHDPNETQLFLTYLGRPMGVQALYQRVRGHAKRARIAKPVSCHTFRHAFATHLLQEGASIRPIQAMLGHESLNATQIYTRLVPQDLVRLIERCHPLERSARRAGGAASSESPATAEGELKKLVRVRRKRRKNR